MNKILRNAVKNAEQKLNEAVFLVSSIEPYLCFAKFGKVRPHITVCNGNEIILKYFDEEMPITEVIERMEEYGYITPNDF